MQTYKETLGLCHRDSAGAKYRPALAFPCHVRKLHLLPPAYLLVTRTPKDINLSDVIPTKFIVDGEVLNATYKLLCRD